MSSAVATLIRRLAGQDNLLTVPRLFVEMTGDHASAIMLSQVIYWQDKMQGKMFYKTDDDFGTEICMSPYQLNRCRSALESFGLSYERKGIPAKMHYKLDMEFFENKLLSFLGTADQVSSEQVPIETSQLIQEIKQEITHKITIPPSPKTIDLEQARKRISEGQENPLNLLKEKYPEFNGVFIEMLRFSRVKAFDQKQMKAKQVLAVLANFKEGDGVRAGNRAMLETTNPSYLFSNFCKFIGQHEDLKEAKSPFDPDYKSSIVMATTTKEEQARINFEKSMRQYDSSN